MGKYLVKKSKSGFMFNLEASNGETILTSEIYSSLNACKNGCESVKNAAKVAKIEDQTIDGFEKLTNPKFEIYLDKAGQFRFRLLAINGENIGKSESYKSKQSCKNGIDSVIRNSDSSIIEK